MSKYKDKRWLEEKYVNERKASKEIADICDVSGTTILAWMERYGIERRGRSKCQIKNRKEAPSMTVDGYGYERFFINNSGSRKVIYVHQLTAIAHGADPDKIFNGYDVHHQNEVQWDNRPENLEVIEHGEHRKKHAKQQ